MPPRSATPPKTGGSGTGHGNTICLDMHNNTVNLGPSATYTAAYRLTSRGPSACTLGGGCSFQLQGFVTTGSCPTASGSSTTDVACYVTNTKVNAGTPVSVTATAAFVNSGGCP